MEPEEINEFSNKMKEAGEGGQSLKVISLAISVLAVLVAMVTVLGHRSHTEAVLSQARASDMWNLYQAKNIRSGQVSVAVDSLSLQANSNSEAVEKKLEDYRSRLDKWKDDMADEQKQAHEFEADVQYAEREALRFDIGEALLQIAVVLCSVTLFTRRQLYFYMGLGLGVAGVVSAASVLLVR